MDNRDLDFTANKLYFTMTGRVPSPHFKGTCVALTEDECGACEAFRTDVRHALNNLTEALDKLTRSD